MTIAVGTDPGLAALGFGVIRRDGRRLFWEEAGTITTDSARPLIERQRVIFWSLTRVLREHRPAVLGIEDQSGVSAGARMAVKRQLEAARRGQEVKGFGFNASNDGVIEVVGIIKAAAFAARVPVVMLQPRSIKVAVLGPGGGKADKDQIKAKIAQLFPDIGRISSHAADGFAAAIGAELQFQIESRRAIA